MLEVIVICLEDVKWIESVGGKWIELILFYIEGGLILSYVFIKKVVEVVSILIYVMICLYVKFFIYMEEEIEMMKEDIIVV